jgi:hypothetical protein
MAVQYPQSLSNMGQPSSSLNCFRYSMATLSQSLRPQLHNQCAVF